MASDDSVARIDLLVQAEVALPVLDQLVEFLKRVFIEKELNTFARSHFTGGVLLLEACCTAARFCLLLALAQLIEFRLLLLFLGRHPLNLSRDNQTTEDTEKI